ncbi:C40 family peptidase [Oceanicola sp. 502str15]|uniref:C40 family peptidase n=1 Tax=Oceanicola sp. 502str15 TaxID=2696061 RepID=UPI0020958BBE|nr:C40 family peptidase [Oceanicola sp. 502str15]MCO6383638.1 NLP/P60 hydrolase [Oceanicola sp. 502str15]
MKLDRRLTPANARVAAAALKGLVEAEAYVEGEAACVRAPLTDICRDPAGDRERQLLMGQRVVVYERVAGWAFVQATADGYVGYVPEAALGAVVAPTHRVSARLSQLYPEPTIKCRETAMLSFGAQVVVTGQEGDLCETPGGFIPVQHLTEIGTRTPRLEVAQLFLGTPYLWGGNSGAGIDCSGLVQAALRAEGHDCPGDSDMQEEALGEAVALDAAVQPGDLYFWPGHVAMALDGARLIHATGHFMSTVIEPLEAALARIEAAGYALRARRRLG